MWKLPRYLWCVKGNTQHKRAEFYWDPWNLKRPRQGPREFYWSPLEPEGTQTGVREFRWSPLEPEGTQTGAREFHWSPLEPEGTQIGAKGVVLALPEPGGTQTRTKGVLLVPPGTWRNPDKGKGILSGHMEPEGAQPRAICGAALTGWRERVEKQWRWRRTLTCCLQQHSCLVSLPSSDTPGSGCLGQVSSLGSTYLTLPAIPKSNVSQWSISDYNTGV